MHRNQVRDVDRTSTVATDKRNPAAGGQALYAFGLSTPDRHMGKIVVRRRITG
jgi:hypothetical protein